MEKFDRHDLIQLRNTDNVEEVTLKYFQLTKISIRLNIIVAFYKGTIQFKNISLATRDIDSHIRAIFYTQ